MAICIEGQKLIYQRGDLFERDGIEYLILGVNELQTKACCEVWTLDGKEEHIHIDLPLTGANKILRIEE